MDKHKAWLADMAKKKALLNHELQASALAAEDKRKKFVAYTRSLRMAVRERAAQMELEGIPHAEPQLYKDLGPQPTQQQYYEPPPPQPTYAPPPPRASAAAATKKPAWAMTEVEAEEVEDEEAEALVEFAKDLDYDSYIDDLEVRQALGVIRERIDAQKAAEAVAAAVEEAEDKIAAAGGDWRSQFLAEWNGDDAASVRTGGSRRTGFTGSQAAGGAAAGAGGQPDWDSSTNAGDRSKGGPVNPDARAMAEQLMMENPELAQKHSLRSLTAVVDKRLAPQITEEDLPPLRVVTIHENPRVPTKDVDPSNLPYLHRNPAV